ncbi:putative major facilitator superfamily transporter [Diaporthe ampelina]|uniref:Putative major facilitator superfamily transporter n=1 Tax=Diaporthe ampelina TaxID=1214573 RepID=A0A0G2FG44_9PEZI|nr:putative major facilitator superfamily transporter [Diaporthe ampelina]
MATQDEKAALEKQPTISKVADDNVSISRIKSITRGEIIALDASEVFLREHNYSDEYLAELLADEDRNKRLVRKIDFVVLPLLAGTYVLQYIDKQAMSYAAVFDLFSSTGINQDQYAWFTSMFYLAYLVAEYPWMWAAQKTRMARIVSACVLGWGGILMITAACHNFAGFGQIQGFPVWKAIFLLCGGVTVVWGIVLVFFLPDSILTAKRFTLEEKALLIARGRLAKTGILNKTVKWAQVGEAFRDPQVWLLFSFVLFNEVINGGYASFGKLIVKGLVTDPLKTTALGIPQGAFQVVWILSGTYIASHFKNQRTTVMALYNIPTIIGVSLIWRMDRTDYANKIGVLIGYYISGSYVASLVLALQMPSANLGGYTKRTSSSALVFLAYCAGNVIGPHAFLQQESPYYRTGCIVILACAVAQVCLAFGLRMMLQMRNKRRDDAASATQAQQGDALDGADATDFENPQFRYLL